MCTVIKENNTDEMETSFRSRIEIALANHKKGYNCCQAVACAYSDLVNLEEETIFKSAEGFGAGMGGFTATCGAVSGAILLAGLQNSTSNLKQPNSKVGTYKLSKEIIAKFTAKNSSIVCKDLKGIESGIILRSCDGCIEDAAKIAEELLFTKNPSSNL